MSGSHLPEIRRHRDSLVLDCDANVLTVTPSTSMRYQQSDPDVRLMMRVRDDDAGAFEELVRRYQDRLVRWFHHVGPGSAFAEDLTQDVFLRVYRSRGRYEAGAKFSTWLFTIAGNVARNAARSQNRRREIPEVDTGNADMSINLVSSIALDASALMPTRIVEGEERAELVRRAVDALGERQKMALMLSRFENMSYAEIAEAMSMSTKAVKSLLSRARVNLKELLADYIDADHLADYGGDSADSLGTREDPIDAPENAR